MTKAYLIYESWGICDDSSVVCVFLDESKADVYIEENNRDREEEVRRYEKCNKCAKRIDGNEETFKLKDSCDNAVIKTDRHGLYCENDMSDFYRGVGANAYWKVEKDILG